MATICPKCAHVRGPDEIVPDWQCPSCGVVYSKAVPSPSADVSDAPAEKPPALSWLDECLQKSESGRLWPLWVPLHLWFLTLAARYSMDPEFHSVLDRVLMPVHEGGHLLFSFMGDFMAALGGSLLQWLAPLFLAVGFVRQGDLYALSLMGFWFGVSLNDSYTYMDSSFQMEKYPNMVFVNIGGGEALHDWQYLFGELGLYRGYTTVAALWRAAGLILMWLFLAAGAWLLWRMVSRAWLKKEAA